MYNLPRDQALPELLCPAGDATALAAAIDAGADAVYLGATQFNARQHATNFTPDALGEAVKLAHAYGVKVYITQNTLVNDRELSAYLSAAESAIMAGIDALIVADPGGAAEIHRRFPHVELHASTQMSGHNTEAARRLCDMGFSRMVCAREMSLADIREFCRSAPIEAEVFVHGALCVCHSGQCLFSSAVGGRSGNRGECAQPCRLPYGRGKESYPLSLKDLALAEHIPDLIEAGVASLKIEGRMKSAEYVGAVARIYRRLLDERRAADPREMRMLADVFSRGGFTDGYFRGRVDRSMLGTRSEADKERSRALPPFEGIRRRVAMDMQASILRDQPIQLTVRVGDRVGCAEGPVPMEARNAPLTRETVTRNLTKLGTTVYEAQNVDLTLDEGLMLPISALNALRREAVAALESGEAPSVLRVLTEPSLPKGVTERARTARFYRPEQIPDEARLFFDHIYLPLESYDGSVDGVALPPVIFDSELAAVRERLSAAVQKGARHALVANLGHLALARELGLVPHGDLRLNVTNTASMAALEREGFADVILSPELTLPQARDVGGTKQVMVYGRMPLMLLEKCVGKELGGCDACHRGEITLRDRRGAEFPVLREWRHRSVVYNSLVTGLSDMTDKLEAAGLVGQHFIFSTETAEECRRVIEAYRHGRPLDVPVRRMGRT